MASLNTNPTELEIMLRLFKRVTFISVVMLFFTGCNNSSLSKVDERKVKFGDKVYSESQVEQHLLDTYKQAGAIYIWNPVLEQIPYLLTITNEKYNTDEVIERFSQQIEEYNKIIGVEFVPVSDGGSYYVSFSYTDSLDDLIDHHATIALYRNRFASDEEYKEYWLSRNDKANGVTWIDFGTLDEYRDVRSMSTAFFAYEPFNSDKMTLYTSATFSGYLCAALTGVVGRSTKIVETCSIKPFKKEPYIWPFDRALLKVLYGNPEISEMSVEGAVQVIFEHFYKNYGVK